MKELKSDDGQVQSEAELQTNTLSVSAFARKLMANGQYYDRLM